VHQCLFSFYLYCSHVKVQLRSHTKFCGSIFWYSHCHQKILLASMESMHPVHKPFLGCFAVASHATQWLCCKLQYCCWQIQTEIWLEKYHVTNLLVCMSCNITYMVPDIVMLLLQHFYFTEKGGNWTPTKHQIFPYWLRLLEKYISIKRRVSLCSCDIQKTVWKGEYLLCWLQWIPLLMQIVLATVLYAKTYVCGYDTPLSSQFAVVWCIIISLLAQITNAIFSHMFDRTTMQWDGPKQQRTS